MAEAVIDTIIRVNRFKIGDDLIAHGNNPLTPELTNLICEFIKGHHAYFSRFVFSRLLFADVPRLVASIIALGIVDADYVGGYLMTLADSNMRETFDVVLRGMSGFRRDVILHATRASIHRRNIAALDVLVEQHGATLTGDVIENYQYKSGVMQRLYDAIERSGNLDAQLTQEPHCVSPSAISYGVDVALVCRYTPVYITIGQGVNKYSMLCDTYPIGDDYGLRENASDYDAMAKLNSLHLDRAITEGLIDRAHVILRSTFPCLPHSYQATTTAAATYPPWAITLLKMARLPWSQDRHVGMVSLGAHKVIRALTLAVHFNHYDMPTEMIYLLYEAIRRTTDTEARGDIRRCDAIDYLRQWRTRNLFLISSP